MESDSNDFSVDHMVVGLKKWLNGVAKVNQEQEMGLIQERKWEVLT